MKTAISLSDEDFALIESAARTVGVTRSEFFRSAAVAKARSLGEANVTAIMNAYIERTGDDGTDQTWESYSLARLESATENDQW